MTLEGDNLLFLVLKTSKPPSRRANPNSFNVDFKDVKYSKVPRQMTPETVPSLRGR